MISDKIIENKVYLYTNILHKVKKVQKKRNNIVLLNMSTYEEIDIPFTGSEILLTRVYTIGELSKIIGRRPDTIRKYEKSGLIPKPMDINEIYPKHKNWRFYRQSDVYEMVEFFSSRTPGRPPKVTASSVASKIDSLNNKVKTIPIK